MQEEPVSLPREVQVVVVGQKVSREAPPLSSDTGIQLPSNYDDVI